MLDLDSLGPEISVSASVVVEKNRVVSVHLSESELSSLNLIMQKEGYKGLGELLGAVASGKYKIGVEAITEAIESVLHPYYKEVGLSSLADERPLISRSDLAFSLGSSSSLV